MHSDLVYPYGRLGRQHFTLLGYTLLFPQYKQLAYIENWNAREQTEPEPFSIAFNEYIFEVFPNTAEHSKMVFSTTDVVQPIFPL